MRTRVRTARHLAIATLIGVLAGLLPIAPAWAQSLTATPEDLSIPAGQTQGSTIISWDASPVEKNAKLWQQTDGGEETVVAAKSKGVQTFVFKVGEIRVFKLYNLSKSKLLASVIVTATKADAAPDDDAPNVDADAPAVSFAGTWPTLAAGTTEFTVQLKQVGNKVTGSYSPHNGKIFDGIVVGRKLTFKWKQPPNWEGTSAFTMDKNGKGFKGSTTALKPQQFSHSWNSYVPEPLALAGVWETTCNDTLFTLTLQQTGDKVTGTYTPGNGQIAGTLKGKILRFTWTSDGEEGSGRLVFTKSEMDFSGSYSNTDDPEQADGLWSGKRKMGGGKGPPASFAGTWADVIKFFGGTLTMTYQFKQTGNQVTGYYYVSPYPTRTDLKDATVSGNTLRFTVPLKGHPDESGQFVMAEDGKSFTGTIGKGGVGAILVSR